MKLNPSIGVIGGGPAGSFFTIYLLHLRKKFNLLPSVTIFETKEFSSCGSENCNMCAGVLGPRMGRILRNLNRSENSSYFEERIVRGEASGFVFHAGDVEIEVENPKRQHLYTVFRSRGPCAFSENEGLDDFLLKEAERRGARVLRARVINVETEEGGKIEAEFTGKRENFFFDFIVGAFGVNSDAGILFHKYREPERWKCVQMEIRGKLKVKEGKIHIFVKKEWEFLFLALIPKGNFYTVTAIGKNVPVRALKEELKGGVLSKIFEDYEIACSCTPFIPVTSGRGVIGKNYLILGDAFTSRYLKSGIESACFSAFFAASSVLRYLSDGNFHHLIRWKKLSLQHFAHDNIYGKIIFFLHNLTRRSSFLSSLHIKQLQWEKNSSPQMRLLTDILWHTFVGDRPYRRIFRKIISWKLIMRILRWVFK